MGFTRDVQAVGMRGNYGVRRNVFLVIFREYDYDYEYESYQQQTTTTAINRQNAAAQA